MVLKYFCSIRQQNVAVALVCIGFLGIFPDQYMAVENTLCIFIQDPFEHLAAGTIGIGMVNKHMVVDVLFPVHQVESVNIGIPVRTVENDT